MICRTPRESFWAGYMMADEDPMDDHRAYLADLVPALAAEHERYDECGNETAVIEWYRRRLRETKRGTIARHALMIAAQAPIAHKPGCNRKRRQSTDSNE